MRNLILSLFLSFGLFSVLFAQDTVVVQTLTYDSTSRAGVWEFPSDTIQWRKVIMQYSMRCHDALVGNGNVGCYEWDYSCNTVITDSSKTDSLMKKTNSHAISNFSGSQFDIHNGLTWSFYDYLQQQVVINSVTSETSYPYLGTGSTPQNIPFGTSSTVGRSQFLWTATELAGQGLTAGQITGMKFNVSTVGSDIDFLRIKIKHSSQSQLDANSPDLNGFTDVYFLNTGFVVNGIRQLNFHTPFVWNGTDNLLVEFSYHNALFGSDNTLQCYNTGSNLGLLNNSADGYLEFTSAENIDLFLPSVGSISNEITISFWAYGSNNLPVNNSVFEGTDGNNARQVNAHLPWSNGDVYWDCGADANGYDRINLPANALDFKNRWTHWAFTKNAVTGEMKIWIDGQLFHSGTGKTKQINLQNFKIGSAWNGGNGYQGKLNEFAIFNKELDSAKIRDWMYRDITASHPNYANLVAYYKMNEGFGNSLMDSSPATGFGTLNGAPNWGTMKGQKLFRNFSSTTTRPSVYFVRGVYNSTINNITVRDSVVNPQHQVVGYTVSNNDLVPVDTNFYHQAGWQYVYDGATGQILDSIASSVDSTIQISTLTYYLRSPSRFEIMSFVTPYGNGLDLGPNGVMWEFDLTDYSPIFNGKKKLEIVHGAYQEELDIRFIFIKGQPSRDVLDIQQIWPLSNSQHGMPAIFNDDVFEPRFIPLDQNSASWKIRSYITGHGQNGEFIARWHWLNVAGGAQDYRWRVWKECSDIPVYPQGGTWLFDRAGWCPGQPSDLVEFEVGNLASPGQLLEVDYGMDVISSTSASSYLVSHQFVSYGANNFNLDAALIDIKRPSKNIRYGRFNPACNAPIVILRNEGTTPLTSVTITYNMKGGPSRTFQWTGNLDYLEMEEVTLPVDNPTFWTGTDPVFEAMLSAPNGGSDQQPDNDTYASEFEFWDSYVSTALDLYWKTNNQPQQNSWKLYDESGTLLMQNSPFLTANTTYTESFNLPAGCYTLQFDDLGDDGLYYWYTPNNGTGFARFRENGTTQVSFEREFGRFFRYDFWTDGLVGNDVITNAERVVLYPNPSAGRYNLEMEGFVAGEILLEVYDLAGRKLISDSVIADGQALIKRELDLSKYSDGTYILKIYDGHLLKVRELVKQSF